MTLVIKSKSTNWFLNESAGKFYGSDNSTIPGEIEYQSNITSRLIKNILLDKNCELPSLEDTIRLHELFLSELLMHWNRSNNLNDTHLPIT